MKKIILDCLGGDNGLPAMVAGAVTALKQNPELKLVMVGDAAQIKPQVAEFGDRVEIIDTKVNIAMDEHPTTAIRTKTDSSLVLGLEQLKKRDDCGAFVSAGSVSPGKVCREMITFCISFLSFRKKGVCSTIARNGKQIIRAKRKLSSRLGRGGKTRLK